jgi:ABC-type histidine transport system ATPase subunit
LTARGATDLTQHLDMVFLYRRALLDWWAEEDEDFEHLVRHVLIHEIGFAREVANKFIFLHQGRIEEQGNPKEVFANPKSDRLKGFLTTAHHK